MSDIFDSQPGEVFHSPGGMQELPPNMMSFVRLYGVIEILPDGQSQMGCLIQLSEWFVALDVEIQTQIVKVIFADLRKAIPLVWAKMTNDIDGGIPNGE